MWVSRVSVRHGIDAHVSFDNVNTVFCAHWIMCPGMCSSETQTNIHGESARLRGIGSGGDKHVVGPNKLRSAE